MNYALRALATSATVLFAVATLNFYADPSGIYRSDGTGVERYAAMLAESAHGVWWPEGSLSDRALKLALAKQGSDADCIVVGSSHILQISSSRPRRSLESHCKSLLNLGVSGASIEDHIALVHAVTGKSRPAKIIFGTDPWIFAFGKTQGWWEYRGEYSAARKRIFEKSPATATEKRNIVTEKITNLVNLEYTLRSLQKLYRNFTQPDAAAIAPAPEIDDGTGGAQPVILPDGSLIYSALTIARNRESQLPDAVGAWVYQTDGELIQPYAVDSYIAFLRWVRAQGIEPVLLMTPYHENFWKTADAPTTRALLAVEPVVRDIGRRLQIEVIGSFDPVRAGCKKEEFLDLHHARPDCLARLGRKQSAVESSPVSRLVADAARRPRSAIIGAFAMQRQQPRGAHAPDNRRA